VQATNRDLEKNWRNTDGRDDDVDQVFDFVGAP